METPESITATPVSFFVDAHCLAPIDVSITQTRFPINILTFIAEGPLVLKNGSFELDDSTKEALLFRSEYLTRELFVSKGISTGLCPILFCKGSLL